MVVNVITCFTKKCNKHNFIKISRLYCTVSVSENVEAKTSQQDEFKNAKPFEAIPGPKPIPILGNLWRFFPGIGKYSGIGIHDLSLRLNQEYGNVVRLQGLKFKPDLVNIYDPKDIEIVCRNEGPLPKRDALPAVRIYRDSRKDVFDSKGFFASDGEMWQDTRSKLNPIFLNPRTVKLYKSSIQEVVNDFILKIKQLSKQDPKCEMPEDFGDVIKKFSLESISVMLTNLRLGLLDLDKEPNPDSAQFLQDVCSMMEYLYQLDILPSPYKYFKTSTYRKFEKTNDRMIEYLKKLLVIAIKNLENEQQQHPERNEKEMTILEKLLKIDRKYLFGAVSDMYFAGVDTSASSIKSWMYYIAVNPDVQERIREEVLAALPSLDSPMSNEVLEKIPYTRASIKEVLRLSPISSGSWRKIVNDIVVSGYKLPKGTNVVLCFFVSGRNPENFPEPEKFKPERWMREDGKRLVKTNPWVMQPFGFGVRSCVGKRLFMMEIEQLVPKIIRNFKMEWNHPPAVYESKLMYQIASPLKIKMVPIES